jgi:hypothetical protein
LGGACPAQVFRGERKVAARSITYPMPDRCSRLVFIAYSNLFPVQRMGSTSGVFKLSEAPGVSFKNINNVFFEGFFTVLISVDVILLLLSYYYTDTFHKVIRNSGFVISTILIRLSFSVDGLISSLLILSAVVFGLLILAIHNQFEKNIAPD